jgi:hypothetical protein
VSTIQNNVYAAGLFEGEGNASVLNIRRKHYPTAKKPHRSPQRVPQMQLKMTDAEPVSFLRSVYGGSIGMYTLQSGKMCYCWRVSNRKALAAAIAISPYVKSLRKVKQLHTIIDHYKTVDGVYPA